MLFFFFLSQLSDVTPQLEKVNEALKTDLSGIVQKVRHWADLLLPVAFGAHSALQPIFTVTFSCFFVYFCILLVSHRATHLLMIPQPW